MPTLVDLSEIPRRDIRYVLFRLRAGTEAASDMPADKAALIPAVRAFLSENRVDIAGFEREWDVGIDDANTMHTRPDKWWLWGIPRTTIVRAPAPGHSIMRIVASGFGSATVTGARFTRADYERILAGVDTRKGWLQ